MWLVIFGLAIHLVFFYSIFDIYFTSPLVHGMTPHTIPTPAPASRLVLFVADGLRADKFFELEPDGSERAPYLRSIIEKRGGWGVSHTRVPTESRPGHVALIAGFYEDVSAVAKGWKENPVEFDSVFNESRYTWSWGSPDILPMFAHGASGDHVFTHCYSAEKEDFAGFESYKLDTWVFNRVKEFLAGAKQNQSLSEMLRKDRVVFFLHLLGLDTNGHSRKPYSREYISNIRVVDDGVHQIEDVLEDFYGHDGKTAYVLTADHGMTDWGSHGAGHPSETLTPLVTWGAGLRHAQPNTEPKYRYADSFSTDWKLEHVKRVDVEQADVAPLMASLIGVPFPLNSVGRLPLDYLEASEGYKAESLFTNAQQILAQFQVKMAQKKHSTLSFAFRPYKELLEAQQIEKVRHIRKLIQAGQYQEAIGESETLIDLSLEGLNYYQTYDRIFLGFSIASGFVGWMAYILALMLEEYSGVVTADDKLEQLNTPVWRSQKNITYTGLVLASVIIFLLLLQSSPVSYYVYCLIPVILWTCVFLRVNTFQCVISHIQKSGLWGTVFVCTVCLTAGTELVVGSFFLRELLSIGLVAMAGWVISSPVWSKDKLSGIGWMVSCFLLAVFPLLPVVGKDTDYNLVLAAGVLSTVVGVFSIRKLDASKKLAQENHQNNVPKNNSPRTPYILYIQIVLILISTVVVWLTATSIAARAGLPLTNQIISWSILGLSTVLPLLCVADVQTRLLSIAVSFLSPYLLLSIQQEGFFYIVLCFFLYCWIRLEHTISQPEQKLGRIDFNSSTAAEQRCLEIHDMRRAYFFVFLILLAFFGTGNIASINSFDPASVYCFLTVFNPFLMGALMMWKNLIPFILVTCTFSAVHVITNLPTRAFFLMVFLISDVLALHFFFLVRDYGSWLDIGTSISHYVIVMSMIIFVVMLFGLSHALTHWTPRRNLLKNHYH